MIGDLSVGKQLSYYAIVLANAGDAGSTIRTISNGPIGPYYATGSANVTIGHNLLVVLEGSRILFRLGFYVLFNNVSFGSDGYTRKFRVELWARTFSKTGATTTPLADTDLVAIGNQTLSLDNTTFNNSADTTPVDVNEFFIAPPVDSNDFLKVLQGIVDRGSGVTGYSQKSILVLPDFVLYPIELGCVWDSNTGGTSPGLRPVVRFYRSYLRPAVDREVLIPDITTVGNRNIVPSSALDESYPASIVEFTAKRLDSGQTASKFLMWADFVAGWPF